MSFYCRDMISALDEEWKVSCSIHNAILNSCFTPTLYILHATKAPCMSSCNSYNKRTDGNRNDAQSSLIGEFPQHNLMHILRYHF